MSLVEGCETYSGGKESGTVDWMGSAKGGGGAQLEGFGGGGNNDCGERGRTNSVVTSGGGEGGMSSVSKVCIGIIFLGGDRLESSLEFRGGREGGRVESSLGGGGRGAKFDVLPPLLTSHSN